MLLVIMLMFRMAVPLKKPPSILHLASSDQVWRKRNINRTVSVL